MATKTDCNDVTTTYTYYANGNRSRIIYPRTVVKITDTGEQSYYYLYNAHGDVKALIDGSGSIEATYDYDAFGNVLSKTGKVNNHITYAGY